MSDTKFLTAADIWEVPDQTIEVLDVPEWGGSLYVRGLTGEERDSFEQSMVEKKGPKREMNLANVRAGLVARAACTEEGVRIFSDRDVKRLGQKSAVALDRVYAVASRLSGLTKEDEEELVEDFSSGDQSEPSTSA